MCCCIAVHISTTGQPCAQRLPAYQQHRPLPHGPVLSDEVGVIAFLRDDFMGGAEEATSAAHTFMQAIITFRNHCVEQFGG